MAERKRDSQTDGLTDILKDRQKDKTGRHTDGLTSRKSVNFLYKRSKDIDGSKA